jgi:hypothetical protein
LLSISIYAGDSISGFAYPVKGGIAKNSENIVMYTLHFLNKLIINITPQNQQGNTLFYLYYMMKLCSYTNYSIKIGTYQESTFYYTRQNSSEKFIYSPVTIDSQTYIYDMTYMKSLEFYSEKNPPYALG